MWYSMGLIAAFVGGVIMDEVYGARAISGVKLELVAFKNEVLSVLHRIESRLK